MVSEPMAAYLRKLKEKNGKLLLVMDVEDTYTNGHGQTRNGIAVRWDSANIFENTTDKMADVIGGLFMLMCKGDLDLAIEIVTRYEYAAKDWIRAYLEATESKPTEKEKARVKELNRMVQNKPKGAEE